MLGGGGRHDLHLVLFDLHLRLAYLAIVIYIVRSDNRLTKLIFFKYAILQSVPCITTIRVAPALTHHNGNLEHG